MKRIAYCISFILFWSLLMVSCFEGKNEKEETDEDSLNVVEIDTINVPSIVEVVGTVGDGTSMNELELITDDGDTIYVECPNNMIMGGAIAGEKVDITYHSADNENKVMTSTNITALLHMWTQEGDDGKSQSLELNEGGRATTYDMSVEYDSWSLKDGKLLLHSPKKIASEQAAIVDTFDIMELSSDKLVLMHGNLVTEFDREN